MLLLQKMIMFFLIMLIGYICRKIGVFKDTTGKTISSIVINIGNPEVTEDIPEEYQNQLPNIDALKDALELYKVVKLRNAIVSYKVLAVNTIN